MCSVCANPQPSFQWTLKNQTLRDGIIATGNRITLDVVRTEDFGSYMCSVNNEVNGEERSELFHIDLVERGRFGTTLLSYICLVYVLIYVSVINSHMILAHQECNKSHNLINYPNCISEMTINRTRSSLP